MYLTPPEAQTLSSSRVKKPRATRQWEIASLGREELRVGCTAALWG